MDSTTEEMQLIRQLVSGDAPAWRAFVESYQRLIYTRVLVVVREYRRVTDAPAVEDLCAEVFAQLVSRDYAMLRRFEGRSRLSTWLCVVVRRICTRRLLGEKRDVAQRAQSDEVVLANIRAPATDPLRELIRLETQERLHSGLRQLNEKQRAIVQLFYMDGCSYREISEQLGVPINSIGPTLQRVQQRLRDVLQVDE